MGALSQQLAASNGVIDAAGEAVEKQLVEIALDAAEGERELALITGEPVPRTSVQVLQVQLTRLQALFDQAKATDEPLAVAARLSRCRRMVADALKAINK